ncbi:MAG: Lrp/AsnC family transcriptional regulator [Methanosarcinales archaeon]|nr:Lrp/AsnC family transcriptional regulator [Methanosarcinales archaeon]
MAKSEEPDIYETTLELLNKTPAGIVQSSLWKQLEIDSRKCTRIVKKLLDDGKVTREPATSNGSSTYLIRSVDVDIPEPVVTKQSSLELDEKYELLFDSKNEFEPCVSCTHDCTPSGCISLGRWIAAL